METAYPVKLTIGDASGVARAWQFTDMKSAEQCASSYLGREWGSDREITVATFYCLVDSQWKFDSEMEY